MLIVFLRPTRLVYELFASRLRATQSRVGAYLLLLRKTHILTLVIKNNFAIHLPHALLAIFTALFDVDRDINALVRPDDPTRMSTLVVQSEFAVCRPVDNTGCEPVQTKITLTTSARDTIFLAHPTCCFLFAVPFLFNRIIDQINGEINLKIMATCVLA